MNTEKIKTPRLSTERLILKEITMKDLKQFYEIASNPEVSSCLAWEYHKSVKETEKWIENILKGYEEGNIYSWGIYNKATDDFMGWIGFNEHFPLEFRCEVGYWLGTQYWNNGFMTEALKCVVEFCIKKLEYTRIEAMHAVENQVSGIVMEKCGFIKEGIKYNCVFVKNRMWDTVIYSIDIKNDNKANDNDEIETPKNVRTPKKIKKSI